VCQETLPLTGSEIFAKQNVLHGKKKYLVKKGKRKMDIQNGFCHYLKAQNINSKRAKFPTFFWGKNFEVKN
jgi:hypothetical protein